MTVLPVVAREMNILARRSGTYWARAGTAVAALLVMGWLLAVAAAQLSVFQVGGKIFSVLSFVAFAYALVAGIHATSDCISEEKREGTLGLLFLTDLKSYDVVLGKLSATSLSAAYALLAILPMISLGLLVGGVTLRQVVQVAAVLGNTLFFSLGLGVFISVLSKNERRAIFASSVLLFLITVAPFLIAYSLLGSRTEDFIWVSPLYPMLAAQLSAMPPGGFTGALWTRSMLLHHVLGWIFLIASCLILPRFINELPAEKFRGLRAAFENYTFGNGRKRKAYRAKLLDRNAFLWLVSRERVKPKYAWGFVLFFLGLHLWVLTSFPNLFYDLPVNGVILLVVHLTLKLWVASEVCNRLIQDRRAGALELLLSTPLSVREIAHGQSLALRRIFFQPLVIVILGELLLAFLAFNSGRLRPSPPDRALTFLAAAGTLMLDVWAIKWVGLWRSLWGKSIERVLTATLVRVLAVPWAVFLTIFGIARAYASVVGLDFSYRHALLTWSAVSIGCALFYALPARYRFLKYFRACAANRFETGAPVFEESSDARAKEERGFIARGLLVLRRRAWAAGMGLLLLTVFFLVARNIYWRHRLSAEAERIRAANQPASAADVFKLETPPPSSQDAAHVLLAAGPPRDIGQGTMGWNNPGGAPMRMPWQVDAKTALERNQGQLHALWQLTNYSTLYLSPTNRLFDFSQYPVLGCMDYTAASNEGDAERVAKNVRGIIAFARLMRASPTPHTQNLANFALSNLILALERRHSLPDYLLAQIAADLELVDRDAVLVECLARIRVFNLDASSRIDVFDRPNLLEEWMNRARLYSGGQHKQLFYVSRVIQEAIDSATLDYPDRLDRFTEWHALEVWMRAGKRQRLDDRYRWIAADLFWKHAEVTARINILKVAVALQRHAKLGHGVPDRLEELVPKYLKAVPMDPFSGQPLKVAHQGSYHVYSVGPNRLDENGVVASGPGDGDIVYRYRFR